MPLSTAVSIIGERDQGQDVRTQNVTAVLAVANIVKTSLGPQGLDKMLVDDIGDVTITNDGATILRQLEVEHPAAKVLVELSQLQDREVGDGTTSVVIVAAELLKRANEMIKEKLHPTNIMSGYKIACKEACKYIEKHLAVKVDSLGTDALINIAKTSMSSKIIGPECDVFSKLVVEAMTSVKTVGATGEYKYPLKSVKIAKCHGKSSLESRLIKGYATQGYRVSQQMPMRVKNAKIACLDMNLNKFRMQLGIHIQVNDPKNLEKIRQKEMDVLKDRVEKIIKAGANVVITTKGLDDLAAKYFVENNIIAFRRIDKSDLRRIAKACGASVVTTMAQGDGEELFDASWLGEAGEVYEEPVGDWDYFFIEGFTKQSVCTILLRGANDYMTDEIERSVHDSLCVVKRCLESGSVVAGGGAVEAALSIYLEDFAKTLGNKEQIAIAAFAEALTIIPKQLSVNAAQDAAELVSKLRVAHGTAQSSDDPKYQNFKYCGLDLVNGKVRNNLNAGVLEPTSIKIKSFKFATEAAITILRIDDMIKLEPKKEEMPHRR
jgi:T-complex protein 1 subunit alpha